MRDRARCARRPRLAARVSAPAVLVVVVDAGVDQQAVTKVAATHPAASDGGMLNARTRLLLSCLLATRAEAQGLVGPSAITSYSGGGGRRHGGYGYVREPAEGFFVAGSSIKEMNGLYAKVRHAVPDPPRYQFGCAVALASL